MFQIILCSEQINMDELPSSIREMLADAHAAVHRCGTQQELMQTLIRAARINTQRQEPFFTVATREGLLSFPVEEIMYCRSAYHRFQIFLAGGGVAYSKTTRCSFAESMAPLLKSGRFLHCERSTVVNLHYVEQVDEDGILLFNGTLLPYPASRRKQCPLLELE
ncbi:MAG: LytTR family transcriptional regulator DNA-binding domain-containing protein [Eubacteriales bacterium]|nr:LytTR family transcriptional regulator DNA-binding domain-containing protein [Eubacteriales bacterium]